jgi:hypothetical protein
VKSNGIVSIAAQGNSSHNLLKYNKTNTRFSCYGSTSTSVLDVSLFVRKDVNSESLVLANDDSERNADLLAAAVGKKVNAVLYGRTFFKDNAWNTLCLPFNVDVEGSPLNGATLKELTSASVNGTTLTMQFSESQTVEANKPYLVKWSSGDDITDPLFEGVIVADDVEPVASVFNDGSGEFVGTYQPVTLEAGDRSVLYLGNDNKVYYPGVDLTLGAFRAYFRLLDNYHVGTQTEPTRIVLNFDDDVVTDIDNVQRSTFNVQHYYDLQGRCVKKPFKRGIYVTNGRKILVK